MNLKLILLTSLIGLISGCNGGNSESNASENINLVEPKSVRIEASQTKSKALVGEDSSIEVSAINDASVAMEIVSVRLISGEACQVTSMNGMLFTTSSALIGECQYEYTVEPLDSASYEGQDSSIVRVSVSNTASDNTLPNLSETTDVELPVIINLSSELEGDLDTSAYMVSEEVTLLGAGSVEVDSLNNTVTYTPTDIGVTRIMYSMSDGASTKLGNIDVAVSDTGNTAPVATDYIREGKLAKDMSVEIDLTDYVSDVEDSVILDSVRAYNAETEITSTTGHTFTFQSPQAGPHEVAYTVTDGRGGYAVGQVYIEVEPDFSLVQDWEDITIYDSTIGTDITFTAPASKVLADYTNTAYTTYQEQDGISGPKYSEVVTMNLKQAQNYCSSRNGRLPIRREWELLWASQGNLFESKNWPTGTQFWGADMVSETSGESFDASNSINSELEKENGNGFVTCVLLNNELVKDFSSSIDYITREYSNVSDIFVRVIDPDGNISPYQDILIVSEQEKGVFSNYENYQSLMTDIDGTANTIYTDVSFNDEVISVLSSSSAISSAVYSSNDAVAASTLPVTEIDKWNRVAAESGTMLPVDEVGIPSFYYGDKGSIRVLSVFNERSFTGRNFIGYVKIENFGENDAISGKLSFIVQQESSTPREDWGDVSYQPGSPRNNKAFEIVTNYWDNRTQVFSGYGNSLGIANMDVTSSERHIWFENNNGHFMVYSSDTPDKPIEPALSFEMDWAGIDPEQPYWVQISSRISRDHNSEGVMTYVTDTKFSPY